MVVQLLLHDPKELLNRIQVRAVPHPCGHSPEVGQMLPASPLSPDRPMTRGAIVHENVIRPSLCHAPLENGSSRGGRLDGRGTGQGWQRNNRQAQIIKNKSKIMENIKEKCSNRTEGIKTFAAPYRFYVQLSYYEHSAVGRSGSN